VTTADPVAALAQVYLRRAKQRITALEQQAEMLKEQMEKVMERNQHLRQRNNRLTARVAQLRQARNDWRQKAQWRWATIVEMRLQAEHQRRAVERDDDLAQDNRQLRTRVGQLRHSRDQWKAKAVERTDEVSQTRRDMKRLEVRASLWRGRAIAARRDAASLRREMR
jgi:regulator of replication initiation timing